MAEPNDFTGPDPAETSRSLEALKALTTEILTLRTTMKSQAKELEKMSASEVAARQEQISKLEALTEAQKTAIRLTEDEALELGAAGKATNSLIEAVIKQTALANKSQTLIQEELKNRESLSKRLEEAAREEEQRKIRGAALQKVFSTPSSLKGVVSKAKAEGGTESERTGKTVKMIVDALNEVFTGMIEHVSRISSNMELLTMDGIFVKNAVLSGASVPIKTGEGGVGGGGGGGGGGSQMAKVEQVFVSTGNVFVDIVRRLSSLITKIFPPFSAFTGRVSAANQAYDQMIDSIQRAYQKFKEFFTLTGFVSFLMRVVGVSLIFVAQGIRDLGKKAFSSMIDGIKKIEWKRLADRIGVGFNNAGKFLDNFSKKLRDKTDQVGERLTRFGSNLAKDPMGTVKGVFNKSMTSLSNGVDKAGNFITKGADKFWNGMSKMAGAIYNGVASFAKGMASSIGGFVKSVTSFVGPLVAGMTRFVSSLIMATAQIIFSAIQLGASLLAAIISFLVPVGATILTFTGSVLLAVGSFIVSMVVGAVTFITGLVAALSPIIVPALLIAAAIGLIIFGIYMLYKHFDKVKSAFSGLSQWIGEKVMSFFDMLGGIWPGIKQAFIDVALSVIKFFEDTWDAFAGSDIGQWLGMKTRQQEAEAEGAASYEATQKKLAARSSVLTKSEQLAKIRAEIKEMKPVTDADFAKLTALRTKEAELMGIELQYKGLQYQGQVPLKPTVTPIPSQETPAMKAPIIINNTAAPVVSGGGGGAVQQPPAYVPVRNQNDTKKELQHTATPRG